MLRTESEHSTHSAGHRDCLWLRPRAKQSERDTEREGEREREREKKERQRDRETERDRERERAREQERVNEEEGHDRGQRAYVHNVHNLNNRYRSLRPQTFWQD